MKKILYVISTLKRSGPTNQLFNLIKNLDRNDFEPCVLTLSPETSDSQWSYFEQFNLRMYTLGFSHIKGLLFAKPKLFTIIEEIKPDIIHTQGIRADLLNAIYFSKKYLTVSTLRCYPFLDYPMKYGYLVGKLMALFQTSFLKKILHPVACSESIAQLMINHKVTLHVIPNGIDTDYYFPFKNKTVLKKKLKLPLDKKIIISVGALSKRKDPVTILKAFLNSNIKNSSILIFLGDGKLKEQIFKISREENKNIMVLGCVNNVNEYLYVSDLFISSSCSEGMPNTVLEALASGLPVILSDIIQHREILRFNKNADIFFPVKNIELLTHLINDAFNCNLANRSKNATKLVDAYFSARIMSNNYQKFYLNI